MGKKWIIYKRTPPDRSTVSGIYFIEAKMADGKTATNVGVSMPEIGMKCRDDPRFRENDKDVGLATIASDMVDLETGDQLTKVTLHDITRFRRAYLGK
jgi:hypothetical protein